MENGNAAAEEGAGGGGGGGFEMLLPSLVGLPGAKKKGGGGGGGGGGAAAAASKAAAARAGGGISNCDGSKKEEWSDTAVFCLLDIYGDKYSTVRRGSLSSRDWEDLAVYVNRHCKDLQAPKTSDQCKYKIENMKRRYKMEKAKRASNASVKILWPFFSRMDQILGCLPGRQVGIPGGVDAGSLLQTEGTSMLENRADVGGIHELAEESQAESESPSGVLMQKLKRPISLLDSDHEEPLLKNTNNHHHHQGGAPPFSNLKTMRSKQAKTTASSDLGMEVANSIRGFAEAMLRIEQAKIDLIRDLERERAENELKRTQMLLAGQMEIVRLLTDNQRRSSS